MQVIDMLLVMAAMFLLEEYMVDKDFKLYINYLEYSFTVDGMLLQL